MTSKVQTIYIKGMVENLKLQGKESLLWSRPNLFSLGGGHRLHSFVVDDFTAQIDQYFIQGKFTQLVFNEGEEVELILLAQAKKDEYQILALLTQQKILHLCPTLFFNCSIHGIDESQNIPKWMYKFACVVIVLSWVYFSSLAGIIYGLMLGFFALVVVALMSIFIHALITRYQVYQLRKALFSNYFMQNIIPKKVEDHRYWYRMKEFIVDLNKLPINKFRQ